MAVPTFTNLGRSANSDSSPKSTRTFLERADPLICRMVILLTCLSVAIGQTPNGTIPESIANAALLGYQGPTPGD